MSLMVAPRIFVTRTVAAEICMEAKLNDAGYAALKLLDQSGHLRFELRFDLHVFLHVLVMLKVP